MSFSSQVCWRSDNPALLKQALDALGSSIEELPSPKWDPATATIAGIRDYQLALLAPAGDGWQSLLLHLNSLLGDPLAKYLSTQVIVPVIVFHEYDQAAWGFSVFEQGERIGLFWNAPEIMEKLPESCEISADFLAGKFGVKVSAITPYLQHVHTIEVDKKAFTEDEFTLYDHWVRVDFMRRLGIHYPIPGSKGSRYIFISESGVNDQAKLSFESAASKKPGKWFWK